MLAKSFFIVAALAVSGGIAAAQDPPPASQPHPTCKDCPSYHVPKTELDAYLQQAIEHGLMDQEVRTMDVGHTDLGIGIVHRNKTDPKEKPEIAEHELITEVFYVIDGGGTIKTGPQLVDPKVRPSTMTTVKQQNGPGYNAEAMINPITTVLKPGDVFVVPAGTGHSWVEIPDHVTYLMIRLDPDKILPLKSAEQSKAHLAKPYHKGQDNY